MTTQGPTADYETRGATPATLDDLNGEAVVRFIAARAPGLVDEPVEDAMVRIGLAARVGKTVVPTVLAVYAFGVTPQLLWPQWGLVGVRVEGANLSAPVAERADIEGPLPTLVEEALAFVRRNSLSGAGGVGAEYPTPAVREAVLNALVHRDLRLPARVAVRLFVDRLEVWSPGRVFLPQQTDLGELLDEGGLSLPRNPLLSMTARVLGLGEQLGRGLPVLRASVAESTGQEVELRCTPTDVLVVIPSGLPRGQPA